MFEQSIDNYLELCQKIGKEPEKEFKGSFNVRIPTEMHKKAALEAAKQNITLNQYVINAIDKSFENSNTKETIIYIPYNTRKITWDVNSFGDFSDLYNEGTILTKKENVSYVGN